MRNLFRPLMISALVLTACGDDPGGEPTDEPGGDVTYADVAPILEANCTGCHGVTPSNGAPNSLVGYDNASARVAGIVRRGIDADPGPMPPSGVVFSDAEIDTLLAWQEAGAPE